MFIKVNGKNLVVGMKWNVMISDGAVSKAVRSNKAVWHWHSGTAFYYGFIPKGEKVVKKDLPLYSAVIAFATAHAEGNALAIVSVPDTEHYVICGVYQGRPSDGFDVIVSSEEAVAEIIEAFTDKCADSSFTLYGDINVQQIVPFTLNELAEQASDYARLKKVQSELVNPVTITIGLALLGIGANFAYQEYVNYRKQEVAKKLAASQKSAQQIYNDALALKRQEVGFFSSNAPLILQKFLQLPQKVGGWDLEKATCKVTQEKTLSCVLLFAKSKSFEVNNQTFSTAATASGFKSIVYHPDLKVNEATWVMTGLPFVTLGEAMDKSIGQQQHWTEFGSQLQKLLPFSSPGLTPFAPIVQPTGPDAGQVVVSPIVSATWKPSGPARVLELLGTFPKYALINNVTFTLDKSPKYRFNESFINVQIEGTVFAKNN